MSSMVCALTSVAGQNYLQCQQGFSLFHVHIIEPRWCVSIRIGGSGWGLVLNVIWPSFLMFSVKICKILMFSVLKKLTVKC